MTENESPEMEALRERSQEGGDNTPETTNPNISQSPLGKVKTPEMEIADTQEQFRKEHESLPIGYKDMLLRTMPSKGMYYREDMIVRFRGATLEEIKHYSSMDETDSDDIEAKVNHVFNNAVQILYKNDKTRIGSFYDLQETDKYYMLFSIRDLSIEVHGRENELTQPITCRNLECQHSWKEKIVNDIFGYYDLKPGLMKWYNPEKRCFTVKDTDLGEIDIYIPTIGVVKKLKEIMQLQVDKIRKQEKAMNVKDKKVIKFFTMIQFLIPDWRLINEDYVQELYRQHAKWSYDMHSIMNKLVEFVNFGIKPTIEVDCPKCHEKAVSDVRFRGGYKSILDLSDKFEELFGD